MGGGESAESPIDSSNVDHALMEVNDLAKLSYLLGVLLNSG